MSNKPKIGTSKTYKAGVSVKRSKKHERESIINSLKSS